MTADAPSSPPVEPSDPTGPGEHADADRSSGSTSPPEGGTSGAGRATGAISRRLDGMRTEVSTRFDAAEERVPQVGLARDFATRYRRHGGTIMAGHLAFRTFVWLMPLLLVMVAVAGLARSRGVDVGEQAGENLGLGRVLGQTLNTAGEETRETWWQAAPAAVSGLVLGTLGLLSGLTFVFARVWDLPEARIEHKAKALAKLLGAGAIVLAVVLLSSALRRHGPVGSLAAVVVIFSVLFVAFLGLGSLLPHRSREWYWQVPGAAVGALGFLGLQVLAVVYFPAKAASASRTYGTLGIAFVALAYLFLVGNLIVASAIANVVWFEYKRPDQRAPAAVPTGPSTDDVGPGPG